MVAELGYPKGSTKWAMFWSGFRAAATGRGPDACPVPDITPAQRRAGRRTPHTRRSMVRRFCGWGWRVTDFVQGELFPEDIEICPTISMQRGDSYVAQCTWCGLLVSTCGKVELGPCPACTGRRPAKYEQHWSRQDLPVGGFCHADGGCVNRDDPFREPVTCHTCGKPVKPEYAVVFRWWDATRVHHPSCIQTFEVGTPVPEWAADQGALPPPEGVQEIEP